MKPHRAGLLLASGSALALLLAACGGSSNSPSPQPTSTASQVFTYDTNATVMDDTWDPATEYSDGIIAMNNMYETLTRYNAVTHKIDPLLATSWSHSPRRCSRPRRSTSTRSWKSPDSARSRRKPLGRETKAGGVKATTYKYAVATLQAECSVLTSPF